MIPAVTRDAVNVILQPMLLLAEVVLHVAPVLPLEKHVCFIVSKDKAIIL
jgi:hypothetical protein